jgi:hypothetical protein
MDRLVQREALKKSWRAFFIQYRVNEKPRLSGEEPRLSERLPLEKIMLHKYFLLDVQEKKPSFESL